MDDNSEKSLNESIETAENPAEAVKENLYTSNWLSYLALIFWASCVTLIFTVALNKQF